ncbi:MAG: Flagellar motor protein MotA [Naasia sp.]|jgi:chemotaxis protein MotA|uniref:motility protein A n=1 Tax=Naasia sp. TaxID=2546198 RepID=UPI0026378C25|nr:MotA/TolQ/ExbB proton channel family protein [Naasia sp.]MCU1570977.1 Flagellar motor protein MotA [Naasia sp.]
MDPATLIGVLLAFGALFAMIGIEGASPMAILLPAPMILVFGATLAVGIASTTLPDAIQGFKALPSAFLGKVMPPRKVIDQVVELAEVARRNGLLALEQEADKVTDPFLKRALQNIADGVDADDLRIMMEDEASTRERTGRAAAKFFNSLGGYSPTIGIIGTVVSLTHVLENLSNPDTLGHAIAAAFVATLWGVLSANFLWLPIGGRLGKLADLDSERMTILIEGIMALQAGSQPRLLGERLLALVPEYQQGKPDKSAKKAENPAEKAA